MGRAVAHLLILPSWDEKQMAIGETLYRIGTSTKKLFPSIPALIEFYGESHPQTRCLRAPSGVAWACGTTAPKPPPAAAPAAPAALAVPLLVPASFLCRMDACSTAWGKPAGAPAGGWETTQPTREAVDLTPPPHTHTHTLVHPPKTKPTHCEVSFFLLLRWET